MLGPGGLGDVHQSVESIRDRARREMIARDIVTMWTVTDTSKKRDPEREKMMVELWKL
jgi:hypothetical protein